MKKLIVMLLICTLVISIFVGCGAGNSKDTQTTGSEAKPTEGQNATTKGTDAPAPVTDDELYTFKIFANFSELKEGDKAFFETMEQANNVKIEFEFPPSTSYAERLQIMLAGGDYPEVVMFPSENDKVLFDAVNNGVVMALNPYLENAPNILKYSYDLSWNSLKLKRNEDIYGIPRTSIARADGYYVRQDWLDAVGLSIPDSGNVTQDEFKEILRAFSKDDPDGNGRNDTYGFGANVDADGNMAPILVWPFGLNGWQKSDGAYAYMDLKYSREHDNFKQALEYTRMLWEEGLIDPDWPVTKRETSNERFKQGITGVYGEFAGHMNGFLTVMQPVNENVEINYITGVKDENGKVEGGSFGTGFWGLWSITRAAEKPERIVQVFDWMLSDDGWETVKYGVEGVSFTVTDNKKVEIPDHGYGWGRAILRRNDDPGFFIGLGTPVDLRPKLERWIAACIEQSVFSKDMGFRPPAADKPEYIDYQKTLNQTISKIIVGDLPVSAYDQALADWYRNGGEEYVQQMSDHIESVEGN